MFRIEGLNPCANCGVLPDMEYSKRNISFICPCCGGESHTPTAHGVEQAIEDWNKWHAHMGAAYSDMRLHLVLDEKRLMNAVQTALDEGLKPNIRN